jgi:multimeric flavodoxin WrbA
LRTLLIVFHSRTGGTRQMAEAAADGARTEIDISVRLVPAAEAEADDVISADGCIFAAPENLAALSGVMKDFFDRSYYPVLGRTEGRPYALLVCAGSDGQNAVRQMERIATGWRMKRVADPLVVCTHAQTAEAILATKQIDSASLRRCRELGATLAAGLAAGVF